MAYVLLVSAYMAVGSAHAVGWGAGQASFCDGARSRACYPISARLVTGFMSCSLLGFGYSDLPQTYIAASLPVHPGVPSYIIPTMLSEIILICCERKILLVGWWLVLIWCERKILLLNRVNI